MACHTSRRHMHRRRSAAVLGNAGCYARTALWRSYLRLGVNIDHVATVRNARGGLIPTRCGPPTWRHGRRRRHHRASARGPPPHPRRATSSASSASSSLPLNFEMAATDEMVGDRAARIRPHAACLVPEKREERTTEGGLDIVGGHDHLAPVRRGSSTGAGIRVSLFVEPETEVDGGGPRPRRAGGRAAHRRLLRGVVAGDAEPVAARARAAAAGGRARRRRSASRSMPATASPSTPSRPSPRSRRSSSSTSAIS